MGDSLALPVSIPGLRAFRHRVESLRTAVKECHAVSRVESGRFEWWGRGKVWRSAPGSIQVKELGDVHRDLALDGPTTFTVVLLPAKDLARVRDEGRVLSLPQIDPGDERGAAFHRLHDAVCAGAGRFALEVAVAEAADAFAVLRSARPDYTRPVRRAVECLRTRLAEGITLDDLAHSAGLDKFHLCRAFRAQVGMPPHAYLTHLRVLRAMELLSAGVRASDLAPQVGLYDQSQLNRHFRRIVGTTPARYGASARASTRGQDEAGGVATASRDPC